MVEDALIASLCEADRYEHPVEEVSVIETHISWIVLTGSFVYKIKKPVDFGFLDFSTLERRRFFCEEELRLNRRFAPELYLEVVALTGSREDPRFSDSGSGGVGEPIIEYAVKMRQFPAGALLSEVAARGELRPEQIDELARSTADFHAAAPVAPPASDFGTPDRVAHFARENFRHLGPALESRPRERAALRELETWSESELVRRRPAMNERKAQGFVRECHGDMHLGNLVLWKGRVTPFDGLEFDESLRTIDVASEIAFVVMDLHDRDQAPLAWRFLSGYLEASGDEGLLPVLRYYLVYRALVRAKVAMLRRAQGGLEAAEDEEIWREYEGYFELAQRFARERRPAIILTHGVSGTGKSTVAAGLVEALGALRVRSDVERKRLFGFDATEDTRSAVGQGLYTSEATERTYARLERVARAAADFGCPVILDATFLERARRESFRSLAIELDVPFVILNLEAPVEILRQRVARRRAEGGDASEADLAVLERQLSTREALAEDERACALEVDAARPPSSGELAAAVRARWM